MNRATEFWMEVANTEKEILKAISDAPLQSANAVWIVTSRHRRNDFSMHQGGMMMLAKLKLAAKLLTEGTHRLASTEEILAYTKSEDLKRGEALRARTTSQTTIAPQITIPDMLKG